MGELLLAPESGADQRQAPLDRHAAKAEIFDYVATRALIVSNS